MSLRKPEAEATFYLKMAAQAEAEGDLLRAKQIYLGNHDPRKTVSYSQSLYVKQPYEAAYIALHQDPRRWIEAARKKMKKGEMLAAEELLLEAERNNILTVYRRKELLGAGYNRLVISPSANLGSLRREKAGDGSWNLEATKIGADRDPAIQAEIEACRAEIKDLEMNLDRRLEEEFAKLEIEAVSAKGERLAQAMRRLQRAQEMKQGLDRLKILEFPDHYDRHRSAVDYMLEQARAQQDDFFADPKQLQYRDSQLQALIALVEGLEGLPESADAGEKRLREDMADVVKFAEAARRDLAERSGTGVRLNLGFLQHRLSKLEILRAEGIRHLHAASLIRQARLELAAGVFQDHPRLWEEGKRKIAALERYRLVETRKEEVLFAVAGLYPEGTPLVFVSDLKDPKIAGLKKSTIYDMRPSLKAVEESQILKTLVRLRKEDPALAEHLEKVLADCRATRDSKEEWKSYAETGFRYGLGEKLEGFEEARELGGDVAALEARTASLEGLYQSDQILRSLTAVGEDERKENLKNEGYRYRQGIRNGLLNLQDYQNAKLGPEQWIAFYDSRAAEYASFLEEEVKRAQKKDLAELKKSAPYLGLGLDFLQQTLRAWASGKREPYRGPAEREAQAKLDAFNAEVRQIQSDLQSLDPAVVLGAFSEELSNEDFIRYFPVFAELSRKSQDWQERHLRDLQRWEIDQVQALDAAAKERSKPLIVRLEGTTDPWAASASLGTRIEIYDEIQRHIDREALRAGIVNSIKVYVQMEKEVDLHDDIWNGLGGAMSTVANFMVEKIDSDLVQEWDDFDTDGNFVIVKGEYSQLLAELDELDPGSSEKIEELRGRFLRLNNMAIHKELQEQYEDSATFNQFTIGTGIVIASAATAGLFSGGVAALGGGRILQGAANATMFTLSARVYRGGVYDGLGGMGQAFADIARDPTGFAEESLLNWGMFSAIGKVTQGVGRAFESRLHKIAVGRLVKQGRLSAGTALTEEMLVENPALLRAYQRERHLLESGLHEVSKRSTSFVAETAAFQGWEFLMQNYHLAKQSRFDPLGAAERAFSIKAWMHGAAFLGALKVGNTMLAGMPGYHGLQVWLEQKAWQAEQEKQWRAIAR